MIPQPTSGWPGPKYDFHTCRTFTRTAIYCINTRKLRTLAKHHITFERATMAYFALPTRILRPGCQLTNDWGLLFLPPGSEF